MENTFVIYYDYDPELAKKITRTGKNNMRKILKKIKEHESKVSR